MLRGFRCFSRLLVCRFCRRPGAVSGAIHAYQNNACKAESGSLESRSFVLRTAGRGRRESQQWQGFQRSGQVQEVGKNLLTT
jgi:hypothetical protein